MRKEFADHDALCAEIEKELEEDRKVEEEALAKIRSAHDEPSELPHNDDEKAPNVEPQALHDEMNRRQDASTTASRKDGSADFISVPSFKFTYTAAPKFEGKDAPLIIKAIVLEELTNINKWRVVPEEFQRVADQYKAGRHLRLNHGKNVEDVIGKSFDGRVVKGRELATYLGKEIDGIDGEGLYVTAEFEANPQLPQVRTNILQGYVETGSIGLDAEAFCERCDKPIRIEDEQFQRTCKHFDDDIKLRNVEVKEYSYVAEPAFQHTKAYPSFSAALESLKASSLTTSTGKKEATSMTETKADAPAPELTAKKAEGEGEGEADARMIAYAEKVLEAYRMGVADAEKRFRADHSAEGEGEGEGKKKKAEAKASDGKTDQITATAPVETPLAKGFNLSRPTESLLNMEPALKELLIGAAEGKDAPIEIRNMVSNLKAGRIREYLK